MKGKTAVADTKHYDLIVIGSGPGGYVGAIRAAQLGMKVACVERDKLGGVCLNWGCIPSKALLHNAQLVDEAVNHGKEWGINFTGAKIDFKTVVGRSRDLTKQLNAGIAYLFKKNKVEHIAGQSSSHFAIPAWLGRFITPSTWHPSRRCNGATAAS